MEALIFHTDTFLKGVLDATKTILNTQPTALMLP